MAFVMLNDASVFLRSFQCTMHLFRYIIVIHKYYLAFIQVMPFSFSLCSPFLREREKGRKFAFGHTNHTLSFSTSKYRQICMNTPLNWNNWLKGHLCLYWGAISTWICHNFTILLYENRKRRTKSFWIRIFEVCRQKFTMDYFTQFYMELYFFFPRKWLK